MVWRTNACWVHTWVRRLIKVTILFRSARQSIVKKLLGTLISVMPNQVEFTLRPTHAWMCWIQMWITENECLQIERLFHTESLSARWCTWRHVPDLILHFSLDRWAARCKTFHAVGHRQRKKNTQIPDWHNDSRNCIFTKQGSSPRMRFYCRQPLWLWLGNGHTNT